MNETDQDVERDHHMNNGNGTIDDDGESTPDYGFFGGVVATMLAAAVVGSLALTLQKFIGGNLGFVAGILVLVVGGTGLNFWIKTKKQKLEASA